MRGQITYFSDGDKSGEIMGEDGRRCSLPTLTFALAGAILSYSNNGAGNSINGIFITAG